MKHIITIPNWHPPLTNNWSGAHWAKKHRLRRATTQMIAAYAVIAGTPLAKAKRKISLTITWNKPGRRPDKDAFDKVFLDACVNAGLLLDDSEDGLDGRMEIFITYGPKLETVITLEDVCS